MRKFFPICSGILVLICLSVNQIQAHVGVHPSVHDTVAGIILRLQEKHSNDEIRALSIPQLLEFLTEEEKEALATEHLSFTVDVPVIVSVISKQELQDETYWLRDSGFTNTGTIVQVGRDSYDVWQKQFDAGWVGLGVNSLKLSDDHYFVALAPQNSGDSVSVENIYPSGSKLAKMEAGALAYADAEDKISDVPEALRGQILIQTEQANRNDANLLNTQPETRFPATDQPDQIVLTWSGDPKTTQTVQWRTSRKITKGAIAYQKKSDYNRFFPKPLKTVEAKTEVLSTPSILNDPIIHRHTVQLCDLEPGTTYVYAVSEGMSGDWGEMREFTTAPENTIPFSFIYMGDAQNGLDRWGTLLRNSFRHRPDAAFYIMAGDLVNRGNDRWDWDDFFYNAENIFDRRTLVPAIGNHENQGGHPTLYLKNFTLPQNGPSTIEAERAYAFEYSNALFVILDSNLNPEHQVEWLDEQLANTNATWKFVIYHHPAYSSTPKRDNEKLRGLWTPLFDKYHVDLALQGHDHAYLRTYPMYDQKRVDSPSEGTIYIVSVSGTKMYEQDPRDYTEFGMTNVSTYQILDIQISGDRLVYKAYDIDGYKRDEIIIEKPKK